MECPACRQQNDRAAERCAACGEPLVPLAAMGERRHMTILFCDLVSSSTLAEMLDPEDLAEVLHSYHSTGAEVIARHGGFVAQYLGDGLLAYFGFPRAHADDATRATRAGLEIVRELADRARNFGGHEVRLSARVGIHSGPVMVKAEADPRVPQAAGHALNVAARLQAVAAPGAVVVSGDTLQLIAGRFVAEELGRLPLKGIEHPVPVHRVLRATGAETRLELAGARGLTPIVGREAESAELAGLWQEAAAGRGKITVVEGEAGIGKSRLLASLRAQGGASHATWLEGRCSPYHQHSAFFPIAMAFASSLDFGPDEGAEARVGKLARALDSVGLGSAENLALLTELLALPARAPASLSAEASRRRLLEILPHWLLALAERRPVVLALEDVHWVDPSTLGLVAGLGAQIASARVLIVLTLRSDAAPALPEIGAVPRIRLAALARESTERMIRSVTGDKALPAEVVRAIADKTDGIPLFVEELTQTLLESGRVKELDDRFELAQDPLQLEVPRTLVDSLAERLDRLGPARHVAQLASVLGREFSYDALSAIAALPPLGLQQALDRLLQSGLVLPREPEGSGSFLFRHALIRDTAYESLTRGERRQLHQRVGETLRADHPETAASQPELLAHHFEAAANPLEAARYRSLAGERALARCAYVEALHHLSRGIALLEQVADAGARRRLELELLTTRGSVFFSTRGYGAEEVERDFARAYELCESLGEDIPLKILNGVWSVRLVRNDREGTQAMIPRFRALAERAADPVSTLTGHSVLGIWSYFRGEFEAALSHMSEAVHHYGTPEFQRFARAYGWDGGIYAYAYRMSSLWLLGFPDRALAARDELLRVAEAAANPYASATAAGYALDLTNHLGDVRSALEQADRLLATAQAQSLPVALAAALCSRGRALRALGETAQALAQLQAGLGIFRMAGVLATYSYYLVYLGEAQLAAGALDAGLATVDEGLGHCQTKLTRFHESQLLRVRGELLQRRGDAAGAEAALASALAIAEAQGARSLALQSALVQAEAWRGAGRTDEARALLAPRYACFDEGHATADLKRAEALLRELA